MKVFIVTEGSKRIGFGHITRSLALYQAFEEKSAEPVFVVNGDDSIASLLNGKRLNIFNWIDNNAKLMDLLLSSDICIIDSYLAGIEVYQRISEAAKLPVYIDDNLRLEYPPGVILNPSVFGDKLDYPRSKKIIYLLGGQYVLLRKEFWRVAYRPVSMTIKSVMVTFGGDDIRNLTPGVLRLLTRCYPEVKKNIVVGNGFVNKQALDAIGDNKTKITYAPDAASMKNIMINSDLAISACGQTLYELARIGTPAIGVSVADNQMNNARALEAAGVIKYAGWWEDGNLISSIDSNLKMMRGRMIRSDMAQKGRDLVDGLGPKRVVSSLMNSLD